MPTEKPRVTITIPEDQLNEVENYRFDNKMKNQTQAILSLVRKGLGALENEEDSLRKPETQVPSTSEPAKGKFQDIIELLGMMSKEQRAEVKGYAKRIVEDNEAAKAAKQIKDAG